MIESHKAASARVFADIYGQGRFELIDELFHPEYAQKPIGYGGHAGVRRHAEELRAAFPDLRLELIDQLAEADGVVNFLLLTGTHGGPLLEHIPPSGRQVTVMGMVAHRYAAGQIVEGVVLLDQLSLLQQIKLVPAPVWKLLGERP